MCQKCVKRSKNLGKPKTVKPGLIRVLARQFYAGAAIPLFEEKAANYAIEAELETMLKYRTRKKYNRKEKR